MEQAVQWLTPADHKQSFHKSAELFYMTFKYFYWSGGHSERLSEESDLIMFSYSGRQSSCGYCSGVLDGFWSCPMFLSSREGACRIVTGLWALVQLHTLLCGYKYFFVDSAVCYVKKQKSRRMLGVKRFCYFDIQLTLTQIMNRSSINIFLITILNV